ncbi:MAG: hypothetical protein JO234_14960, partial [Hyphomicrobiales bacterium]|nr:hypothetical protein [Hyphomicrobiales bacterium]
MRHFSHNMNIASPEIIPASRPSYEVSNLIYLWSVAKRRKWYLALGVLAGLFAGFAYLALAKQTFTGTCLILIEPPAKAGVAGAPDAATSAIDSNELDSQAEVIRSWQVADLMTKSLSPEDRSRLAADFRPNGLLPAWMAKGGAGAPTADGLDFARMLRALSVTRMERTYVLSISFTATDPNLAANVANGFANAYRQFLHDRRLGAEQGRKNWVQQRLDQARLDLLKSDKDLHASQMSAGPGAADGVKRELAWNEQIQKVYRSLLQAKQELSDQSFGDDYFHVITPSEPGATRRSPTLSLVIVLSLVAGLAGASVAAGLAEMIDRSFRTRGQVEDLLGSRFLGWLPTISNKLALRVPSRKNAARASLASLLPPTLRISTDKPQSVYAETLREIRACASLLPHANETKIIGVVSALPKEGKSTLTLNMGRLLAREGARLLVIDGDLRSRGLSRILAPSARSGLYELLGDGHTRPHLEDLLIADESSGMRFLPIANTNGGVREFGNLMLKFDTILTEAKTLFDIVLIDLPPFAAAADARLLSTLCTCFVLVTQWGKTNTAAVSRFLYAERDIRERLLG